MPVCKLTIEKCKEIAQSKDFIILSEKYEGINHKLKFKCKEKGHFVETTIANIKRSAYCNKCTQ